MDYDEEIAQFPYLDSERELILRAMLSTAVDTGSVNRTPSSSRAPPSSMARGAAGGGRSKMPSYNSVNSGMSDASGSGTGVSSMDELKRRGRGGGGGERGQKQRSQGSQEGGEESRSKRKRSNEVWREVFDLIKLLG